MTFTGDGTGQMAPLVIDVMAINDPIVEGVEDYNVSISNAVTTTGISVGIDAANNLVNTQIQDTIDAAGTALDSANWSITGSPTVGEGANAKYTVGLSGTLQAGETATVQLTVGNIDAIAPDRANFVAAVNTAVANYTGPGTLAFDGTFLTFTSDGNPMGDLCVDLTAIDDVLIEGNEAVSYTHLTLPTIYSV